MMRTSSSTEMTATMTSTAVVNSTARTGCIRCIIPRARSCAVIRATTLGGAPGNRGRKTEASSDGAPDRVDPGADDFDHRDRSGGPQCGGLRRFPAPCRGLTYPLPRDKVAQLVDNLKAAGAKVIAFDVIYRSASQDPAKDVAMREAIDRAGNVVLAEEPTIGPARNGVYTTTDLSPITPEIAKTTGAIPGQVHLNKDPSDGVSRSVPLVVSTPDDEAFVPALSVAAVMKYRGLDPSQ